MPPFTLLRRLIDCWLNQGRVAPDLAQAVADPATPWPRLVTLSAVHHHDAGHGRGAGRSAARGDAAR